nr:MAG TPA_asm: hypothetical protein [Caudoviricetes sp.]
MTVLGLADRLSHPVIFQHFDNRIKEVICCSSTKPIYTIPQVECAFL